MYLNSTPTQINSNTNRFLVKNTGSPTTVLTRMDDTNFKSKDQDYKDLELESVEVCHYRSWSDCNAVEAALQFSLDKTPPQELFKHKGLFLLKPLYPTLGVCGVCGLVCVGVCMWVKSKANVKPFALFTRVSHSIREN
jgi:hypothetical protein